MAFIVFYMIKTELSVKKKIRSSRLGQTLSNMFFHCILFYMIKTVEFFVGGGRGSHRGLGWALI